MIKGDSHSSRHEPTDLRGGVVLWGAFLMLPLAVAIHAIIYLVFGQLLRTRDSGPPAPAVQPSAVGSPLIDRPALLATPLHPIYGPPEVNALRAEEDAVLTSYGFVDRQHGIVHIPIAQAIKLIVEHGPYLSEFAPAGAARAAQPGNAEEETQP
jgi:hypothetical protein